MGDIVNFVNFYSIKAFIPFEIAAIVAPASFSNSLLS